ncbi:MAG: serine protease [Kordiimonas sp.]
MKIFFSIAALCTVLVSSALSAQDYTVREVPENQLPEDVITSFHRKAMDSNVYPWRTVGRVNVGGTTHCTGSLIAENIVLTAAHCLYSKSLKTMVPATMVQFLAGYAHGEYAAHSRVIAYETGDGFNGQAGANTSNMPHDWALLILADPIGAKLGHIELHGAFAGASSGNPRSQRAVLSTSKIAAAGYPQDRAHILSIEQNCKIVNAFNGGAVLVTSCISLQGDSGGPILQETDDGWVLVGLQTAAAQRGRVRSSVGVSALAFIRTFSSLQEARSPTISEP